MIDDRTYKGKALLYEGVEFNEDVIFYCNDVGTSSIVLEFYKDLKTPYYLDGARVAVNIAKKDGHIVTDFMTVTGENKAEYIYPINGLTAIGKSNCTILVYDGNGDRITFGTFKFRVKADIDGNVESTTEYPVLNKLISDVDNLNQNINSNETLRIVEENYRKTNEVERKNNETDRVKSFDDIKKEYTSIKGIMIDENNAANLQDQVNRTNEQLEHKANEVELDVERKRIDSFTSLKEGSTTGDAELIDAREGADGVTYNNVGGAIRNQFQRVNTSLYEFTKGENIIEHINMIHNTQLNPNNGGTYEWESISCSPFIPVQDIKYAAIGTNDSYSGSVLACCYYDENKNFLGSGKTQGNPGEFYYYEGQKFIRFSVNTSSLKSVKGIVPYVEGSYIYDVKNDIFEELYLKKEDTPKLVNPIKYDLATVDNKISDMLVTEYRNICNSGFEDGSINYTTGLPVADSSYCRMKDFVPIIGGKEIIFTRGSSVGANVQDVFEYDYNYNFIKVTSGIYNSNHTSQTTKLLLHEDTRFIKTRAWFTGVDDDVKIVYAIYYTETGLTKYEPYSEATTTLKSEYIPKEEIKPVIVFNFDLTNIDERYNILQKYGYTGTWQFGYDEPQHGKEVIGKLVKSGHDISPYTGLSEEEYKDTNNHAENIEKLKVKIDKLLKNMEALGLYNPTMFSCARHRGGHVVSEAVKQFPFRYIRCSWGVDVNGNDYYVSDKCEPTDMEQYPLPLAQLPTFAQVKNAINGKLEKNCKLIMPMCHSLPYDDITEPNYYENLVSYVKQLENDGIVEVMNMREYYERHFPIQGAKDDRTRLMSAINDIKNLSLG